MSERYPGGFITKDTPVTTQNSATGVWTLDQAMQATRGGNWPTNGPFYIEECFNTTIYTGNGTTQTITNGIDLSNKGGMVWARNRAQVSSHELTDTVRGAGNRLISNSTTAQDSGDIIGFTSSGFTLGNIVGNINQNNQPCVSWTFREQPRFFDIVTYTTVSGAMTIPHNLGSTPGCWIIKSINDSGAWFVYHRSSPGQFMRLNGTSAVETGFSTATSTDISISTGVYSPGTQIVIYLFAHNAGGFGLSGNDNVISCGSYTGNNGNPQQVELGYEPQWLFVKNATLGTVGAWWSVVDSMRGMSVNGNGISLLRANTNEIEVAENAFSPYATGFNVSNNNDFQNNSNNTYIYIAIRRGPMRTPTAATAVFQPVTYQGNFTDNRLVGTNIVTDMAMARIRTNTSTGGFYAADRLRGNGSLGTAITDAENFDSDSFMRPTTAGVGTSVGNSFSAMNGFGVGNDVTRQLNQSSTAQLAYAFRRAPGFFDEVCYTGTGVARTVAHNLAAVPELMIIKRRDGTSTWPVWSKPVFDLSSSGRLLLNEITERQNSSALFNSTAPTNTVFTLGDSVDANASGATYVNYLFASCPGVSKVGSYTGNGGAAGGAGTAQTINCGFSAGSRFVLVKCTSNTGEWFVFDSARGIVAGNDPYLQMQSSAAELTGSDAVDTDNSGFIVNQIAATDLNVTGRTYIFLAIA